MKSTTNKNIFMAILSGTGGFLTAYIILGLLVSSLAILLINIIISISSL